MNNVYSYIQVENCIYKLLNLKYSVKKYGIHQWLKHIFPKELSFSECVHNLFVEYKLSNFVIEWFNFELNFQWKKYEFFYKWYHFNSCICKTFKF